MSDTRLEKFAKIIIDYSTEVKPGDRVAITTSTAAEPLVRELYGLILERGGLPHLLIDIVDQEEIFFARARDSQLDFVPEFHRIAYEKFDVLIKVRAETNTRALTNVDPARQSRRQKALSPLLTAQVQRGGKNSLRWISTLYPTIAYAMEADMGYEEFCNYVFRASYADAETPDPVAAWQAIQQEQRHYIELLEGQDRVEIRGPHTDLSLSIKGRKFINASGRINLPDGEIYTGPVEESVNGWVRFTYPANYQGHLVQGVELTFKDGKVVKATAENNQEFLLQMLDVDTGARYLGEFAIGTNRRIDRFTKNILIDEKIGGSFHLALGLGYPETGSRNKSSIHWDLICDIRQDTEILVDKQAIYRNGQFL